jgi:hypothetical protein
MKNIHLLPTKNGLPVQSILPHVKNYKELNHIHQNIYITNDKEIKEGYVFNTFNHTVYKIVSNNSPRELLTHLNVLPLSAINNEHYFNIILTTDQDLIKDGVQTIPDEFLEWFVKNPSCEFVEIVEKLKCFNLDELRERHLKGLPHIYSEKIGYTIIIPQEEPKQQTLEEATEEWYDSTEENKGFPKIKAFKAGAKWQEQRMYSDEEVVYFIHKFLKEHQPHLPYVTGGINMWFEQFKKK